LVVILVEVLGGEHLKGVVCDQRCSYAVRAVNGLAEYGAFHEIHLGRALLQPFGANDAQEEPGGIAHCDQALRLLGYPAELSREHVFKRAKRVLAPPLSHRQWVRLDRNHQFGRLKPHRKRTPPRLNDPRPQAGHCVRWKLGVK
jgi:hypothetical protein